MSRIGQKPIPVPEGVTLKRESRLVSVTGPKGALQLEFRPEVDLKMTTGKVEVVRTKETPKAKAIQGLSRSLIANMVAGVTTGWNKGLELVGVGYRVTTTGTSLVLNVGFSHQVNFSAPPGISFEVKDTTKINVSGIDKQLVGETAAQIRRIKPPEPYKGKGIRYSGERVKRKAGKAAKAAGAPK